MTATRRSGSAWTSTFPGARWAAGPRCTSGRGGLRCTRRSRRRTSRRRSPAIAGFRLVGVMGYEGQIAGLGDAPPGHPVRAQLIRLIQGRSVPELNRRRTETIRLIQALTTLEFVNGGGTGSLESTARDASVTELTGGSGLVGPTLFDAYRRFTPEPALLFALPVVRRPGPGIATLFSGGYVASGAGTPDRLPRPYLPAGLSLIGVEGAGEVQTPVRGAAAGNLRPGDRVLAAPRQGRRTRRALPGVPRDPRRRPGHRSADVPGRGPVLRLGRGPAGGTSPDAATAAAHASRSCRSGRPGSRCVPRTRPSRWPTRQLPGPFGPLNRRRRRGP